MKNLVKKVLETITGIKIGDKASLPQLFGDLHIHFHFSINPYPPQLKGKRKDASKGN